MNHITPKLGEGLDRILSVPLFLRSTIASYGSPLNIILPREILKNVHDFHSVFTAARVEGRIFFPLKPNKSESILRELALSGVGVDVASSAELIRALAAGFPGERIEATGPKNNEFIRLGIQHQIVFNVDSRTELARIIRIKKRLGARIAVKIWIRLAGFPTDSLNESRFGIPLNEVSDLLADLDIYHLDIICEGLSFHLDSGGEVAKVRALDQLFLLLEKFRGAGHIIKYFDIGGQFPVRYAASGKEWHDYLDVLARNLCGEGKPLTWNKSNLGYTVEHGRVSGTPHFRDQAPEKSGAQSLATVLQSQLPSFGKTVADMLAECLITLVIEPGRALLDGVGCTLASVIDVKRSTQGNNVVVVSINRSNLNTFDIKPMIDPILIPRSIDPVQRDTEGCFLAGNLCLPGDILMNRRVYFGRMPEPGDVIFFANTAGYQMDFAESTTLGQHIARKIAVVEDDSGNFSVFLDETYTPLYDL